MSDEVRLNNLTDDEKQNLIDLVASAPGGVCIVVDGNDVQIMRGTSFEPIDQASAIAASAADAALDKVLALSRVDNTKAKAFEFNRAKKKRLDLCKADLLFPGERYQHGDVRDEHDVKDPDGWPTARARAINTLDRLYERDLIDDGTVKAAIWFAERFFISRLEPRVTGLYQERLGGGGGSSIIDAVEDARAEIHQALCAVGGTRSSPISRALIEVVGEDRSINQYALSQSWGVKRDAKTGEITGTKKMHQQTAEGIVVVALENLKIHYEATISSKRKEERLIPVHA